MLLKVRQGRRTHDVGVSTVNCLPCLILAWYPDIYACKEVSSNIPAASFQKRIQEFFRGSKILEFVSSMQRMDLQPMKVVAGRLLEG